MGQGRDRYHLDLPIPFLPEALELLPGFNQINGSHFIIPEKKRFNIGDGNSPQTLGDWGSKSQVSHFQEILKYRMDGKPLAILCST